MSTATVKHPETKIKVDKARIDRLKEQHLSTPQTIDSERIRFMAQVYEGTAGYQNIIRRAKFLAHVLDNKKLYIDENLIVGSMASTVNGVYTYPEWNVQWMKEEKTVENSKTPEDRKANQWALEFWDKWALRPRADEIFIKKYGYDPAPVYQSGLVAEFMSWPGGGGNLNYPRVYNGGLASMIKEVEERQVALDMRLPNAPKFYFYEACQITMKAIIRLAHRYAELAREMAAKEKDEARREELISIAETCEWVPEHPARNLREAIQSHFLCHICAEIEQVGCGYSEAYLGQNLEPFYQRDKAAGLVGPEEATYLLELLFIKLNEIGYYYGEKVALANSADLGQSITLGGFTEDGEDATAEMDYLILDAAKYLRLPQPPLSCCYTEKMSGKFLEKVLDVIDTGVGMPQFVNGDVMIKRALNLFANSKKGITLEKARRTCVGACVGSYIPYETGHPVEGQPNLGKVLELTMNDGFDTRTKKQLGPKTGDPEKFKDFEELYTAFEKQLQFCEDTLRKEAWIASILCAEYLPVTWRSILTGGCIETGTEVWNGGANYYTVAQIVVGGVDAANGLLAVKHLVYDTKKLTMAELKKALAANFEGEYEKVRKLCYEAPKHGNDIPEVNRFVRRVYNTIWQAFQNVDGGGNYISKDIQSAPDAYTKSIHNMMGLVTGALPTGKKAGVALTDGSLSAMPGTDVHGPTALAMSAAKSQDSIKFTATHMNMKLPPNQLKTRKGRETLLNLIKTYMDNDGYHIQFNVLDTAILRDAQKNPENYRDLVVRVAGFSAFFTRLHPGVQNEIIARTEQSFGNC
jgi:pyruvate formate-lyase/glycerol dehydratase family glycyl radical enzyme